MNKETIAKMKKFYEDAIIDKLSEVLGGLDKKNITANWAIDETSARVDITTNDTVTIFNFIYKDENLTVDMESYRVLFAEKDGQRYINGVQNKSATTDTNTLIALRDLFKGVVEADYVEADEAPAEEVANIEDAVPVVEA